MTETEPSTDGPERWQPWGPWVTAGTGLAVIVVYLVLSVLAALSIALFDIDTSSVTPAPDALGTVSSNPNIVIASTLVSAIIGTLLILLITSRRRGVTWMAYLAIRRPPTKELLVWLGITVAVVVLLGIIGMLLNRPPIQEFWVEVYSSSSKLLLLVVAVIAAPLFEESLFRGFLFRGWSQSKLGSTGTILLTAALFTVLHVEDNAFDFGQIFVLGIVLGIARHRSGTLVVPVAMHALNNVLAFLQTAYILGV